MCDEEARRGADHELPVKSKGRQLPGDPSLSPASHRVHKDCFTDASLNHEPILVGDNLMKSRNPSGKQQPTKAEPNDQVQARRSLLDRQLVSSCDLLKRKSLLHLSRCGNASMA